MNNSTGQIAKGCFVTTEHILEHHGVKGQRWGVRRNRDNSGPGGKAAKPAKLTREQVKAERDAFYQKKAQHILDTAIKQPESLIALRTQNDAVIVTGKEFVNHMSRGGLMDIRASDVYATRPGNKGPYVLNPNINTAFVRSDGRR